MRRERLRKIESSIRAWSEQLLIAVAVCLPTIVLWQFLDQHTQINYVMIGTTARAQVRGTQPAEGIPDEALWPQTYWVKCFGHTIHSESTELTPAPRNLRPAMERWGWIVSVVVGFLSLLQGAFAGVAVWLGLRFLKRQKAPPELRAA